MAGRFPLFTDNHVRQQIVEGLLRLGWQVTRCIDVFEGGTVDDVLFEYAAQQRLVFVTSDKRIHAIAVTWLASGRAFRMVFWKHKHHERMSDGDFIAALEELAAKHDAFAYPIEYIKPRP